MEYFEKNKCDTFEMIKGENVPNILRKMDNDGKSRNGMLANGFHMRVVLASLLKNETCERAVESTEM